MSGQASGVPLGVIQIVPGIEILKEFHTPEIAHGLHGRTLHLHAHRAHTPPGSDLRGGLPVKGVRRPRSALHIRIPKFPKNLDKFGNIAGVDVDQIACRGIMIAGALIPDGFCGNDDAAVLDSFVQNAAVAQQDEPACAMAMISSNCPTQAGAPTLALQKPSRLPR